MLSSRQANCFSVFLARPSAMRCKDKADAPSSTAPSDDVPGDEVFAKAVQT